LNAAQIATTASVVGNVTGGNLLTGGLISAAGNIAGNVFIGNGSQLTGITSSYGNANVVANLAALGSNPVSTTGNVTAGNLLFGSGVASGTGNITGGNLLTGGVVSATANITGGNILTAGLITATGNVTGGNLLTAGIISATGTITSAGNISLTGNIVDIGELWINTTANGNIKVRQLISIEVTDMCIVLIHP
jgi:filamentous hemagglutinin